MRDNRTPQPEDSTFDAASRGHDAHDHEGRGGFEDDLDGGRGRAIDLCTASASIQVILITAEAFMFMGIMDKVVPLSKAESEGGGSIITLL